MKNFKDGGFRKKAGGSQGGGNKFGGGDRRSEGGFSGGRDRGGDRGDRGGDRGDRGGDRGGRGNTEMFAAVCSTCGKSCEVPFRPSGDKPVYCSACFGKMGDSSRDAKGGERRESSFKHDSRPQRDERPARFERDGGQSNAGNEEIKRQLATLESKLNRILDLINPPVAKVKVEAAAVVSTEPKKDRKPKTVKTVVAKKKAPRVAKTPKVVKIPKVTVPEKNIKPLIKKGAKKVVAKKVAKVAKPVAKKAKK